jgi:hypothetical protein
MTKTYTITYINAKSGTYTYTRKSHVAAVALCKKLMKNRYAVVAELKETESKES